jgi:hypothetical protein
MSEQAYISLGQLAVHAADSELGTRLVVQQQDM